MSTMMSEKSTSSLPPSPSLTSTRHGSPPLQAPRSPLLIPGSPGFPHQGHSYKSSPDIDESSRPLLSRASFSLPASPTAATSSVHLPRLPSRRRWPVLMVVLVLIVCGVWLQRDGTASVSLRHAKTGLKHLGNKLNDMSVVKPWSGAGAGGGTEAIADDDADWDDTTQTDMTNPASSPSRPTEPDMEPEPEPEPEEPSTSETLDNDGADRSQGLDMPLDVDSGNKQSQADGTTVTESQKEIEATGKAAANDKDVSEAARMKPSAGNDSNDNDTGTMEQAEEEMEEEDSTLSQHKLDSLVHGRILNVRPYPRDPPRDPKIAATKRYLAFDNHSGFHNQRKSLVNALVLAKALKRTLLLPPVRLGHALAWGPDVSRRILFDEECKAGLSNPDAVHNPCKQEDSDKWTYVGWSYLIQPGLVKDRDIVDRWNSSMKWVFLPSEEGGLGLNESDVYTFADPVRRSWQFYDDSKTPTDLGPFATRVNLEELLTGPMSEYRMIKFGSLFGGGRMVVTKPENVADRKAIESAMILQQPVLDSIAQQVGNRLGVYAAVHLRVGDGFFRQNKINNMAGVFRNAVKGMFRLPQVVITALLDESEKRQKALAESSKTDKNGNQVNTKRSLPEIYAWHGLAEEDDDENEPFETEEALVLPPPKRSRRSKRSSARLTKRTPMSSTLTCRKPLHTEKHLLALNSPLYIATDSRDPLNDPALFPFFDHFPCAFLLNDFAAVSKYNSEPVEELVHLVEGRFKSEWDGQNLARYFFGFLEAEIAARATKVVGTPGSTFSGYTSGILHKTYVAQGLTSPAA